MSYEDELRKRTESMSAAKAKQVEEARQKARMDAAYKSAGMTQNTAALIVPAPELQDVIKEAMPHMQFINPKIVRTMPDGRTLARTPKRPVLSSEKPERPDQYSFDVVLYGTGDGKGATTVSLWVFKNGAIAFSNSGSNITWASVCSNNVNAAVVRDKIISTIADNKINHKTAPKKDDGCYIATAVYGSYDCPQVWTLRRFRDTVLKQNVFGKAFVKIYYKTSPTLVKAFGNYKWFNSLWMNILDKFVCQLKRKGYSDKPYQDKK